MSGSIKRALAIRFGGMGDILMTTPTVRAVAETFQTEAIDYIVARGNKDALLGIPYIGEVIEFGPRGTDVHPRNFWAFVAELRRRRYDLLLNFQPSVKTLTLQAAVAASRNYLFLKDRRPKQNGKVRHAIDDFSKDLRQLGISTVPDRRMDFAVPESANSYVRDLLHAEGVAHETTLIVVNPGGTREINRWPPPKFAALLDALAERHAKSHFVITGGPDDVARAQTIYEGVRPGTRERLHNMARRLSIKETGALLRRASVFVTVDTGPMHVACALQTPLVVLSGAADPARTGPLNANDLVVMRNDLDCVPCGERFCRRGDIACMNGMEVEWVVTAVQRRLFEIQGGKVLPMAVGNAPIQRVTATGLVPISTIS